MSSADLLGKRGEATVERELLSLFGGSTYLFDPWFLDGKFPTFDLLVQLVGSQTIDAFFFAQVKTTRQGVRPRSRTLPVNLDRSRVTAALRCPVPSDLLVVDDLAERVYLTAIDGRLAVGARRVPTTRPLNAANARRLWNEVELFWKGVRPRRARSHFSI